MFAGKQLPEVVYIIGTYPRLTTTFIDREIAVLRQHGMVVRVISLRRPDDDQSHDQAMDDIDYVLPAPLLQVTRAHLRYLVRSPRGYVGSFWRLVAAPHRTIRQRTMTMAHFGMAVYVAGLVERSGAPDHIHAHFVDRSAVVAFVVGRLLGLPYSATAHANDIYVDPVLLDEKISAAKFIATCTQANADHLAGLSSHPTRVRRIYHGLDVADYGVADRAETDEPLLLSVGQLKEKKGFLDLIEASRLLVESGRRFRCEIVGEGPQRGELEARIAGAGMDGRVVLRGALSHDKVKAAYAAADVFVLPCIVGSDGDRDGIPNVILEAMASGLPVVSTHHSGIPEAVEDGISGRLVPPGDIHALSAALGELIDDAEVRRNLGEMARRLVAESFDLETNVARLLEEFVA